MRLSKKSSLFSGFLLLLLSFSFLATSCGDDDDDTGGEPLLGVYAFESAFFVESVTFTNDNDDDIVRNIGDNGAEFVSGPLLEESPCTDPDNSRIEFRNDFKTYFVCVGETTPDAEQGTWIINSGRTTLTITVVTDSSPTGNFVIPIQNLVITDEEITGRIESLPVPINIDQPLGQDNLQFIKVDVTFSRVN